MPIRGYSNFFNKRGKYMARRANRYRRKRVSRKRRRGGRSKLAGFRRRNRLAVGVSRADRNRCLTHLCEESSAGFRNVFPLATQSLYGIDCTNIRKSTGAFERTRRWYGQINFKGIKYQWLIRNDSTDPVVFNYACISFKNDRYSLTNTTYPAEPYQVPSLALDGFLRYDGLSRDENLDTGISGIIAGYNPISTDQYNIHMHKRVTLAGKPGGSAYTYTYANNYRRIKGYVPIKRVLRYNDDANEDCESPIYLVYWVTPFHQDPGAGRVFGITYVQQMHTSYFTNVAMSN